MILHKKEWLLALFTVTTALGLADTTANAKTIWSFGNKMKTVRTAPKSIRGNWYGFGYSTDKHPLKLSVRKKGFVVPVKKHGKTVSKTLTYAKNWKTAYKGKLVPNVDLRKESHGWYYFSVNGNHWNISGNTFFSGMIQPVKYQHTTALAYYPITIEKKGKVLLLTKKKYNHPVYMSTKHLTIVNLYGGK